MSKVTLKNIFKKYPKGQVAANDVSFTAEDGEFVVLVGPSGCGKSTILRMIAGLEDITSGEIYFNGEKVNDTHPKDRDVGMVFQNYALYPHLTVFENIAFPLSIRREKKSVIRERVNEIAEMIGMKDYLKRKPRELSGGQRQRVALGRAIIRKPRVFLFDEPLSNLDAKLRVQMRAEISNLHKTLGITSVYVTHDQVEAMTMGTKLVVLKDGVVQQIDSPNAIYNHPANVFVAGFIGSPQINFFTGMVSRSSGSLRFIDNESNLNIDLNESIFVNRLPDDGDTLTLGLRPESIHLAPDSLNDYDVLEAVVINVEYVGHEVLIYFRAGNDLKCCRSRQSFADTAEGKVVSFFIDKTALVAFDETGLRI